MTLDDFVASLASGHPPESLEGALLALWLAHGRSWEDAHTLVQDLGDADAAWVHGHLHRIEGDLGNAAYWYRRAGRPMPQTDFADEWRAMAADLLARRPA